MKWIVDGLQQFVIDFSKNAFFRSLAYGIIFSIIMILIIGDIVGVFQISANFPYINVKQQSASYWIGIVFVGFSFLFAFFGYFSDLMAREDILSPLRKKLVGYWEVRADTWKLDVDKIEFGTSVSFCTIGIDDIGRKLLMHFEIRDSDVFKNQDIDITHITLSYQGEPRQLIYFHEFELALKEPIGEGVDRLSTIKFPFIGILKILAKNDEVVEMEGRWYDIDNAVYSLAQRMPELEGFDEFSNAVEKGTVTFKGGLNFRRLPKPGGTK